MSVAPFFYDALRADGFVEDVHWNAADHDTRRRCLALADLVEEEANSERIAELTAEVRDLEDEADHLRDEGERADRLAVGLDEARERVAALEARVLELQAEGDQAEGLLVRLRALLDEHAPGVGAELW